ncbi:Histidinol-phosphate aminotransferase [hydrothermal vent metagenome]|uniref:Histidinol-phosphate aminotransferase n=1 Tax=hydrothermal vent metagenome TaxID=652676 RepID=A0A3B1AS68_9ZZZZ
MTKKTYKSIADSINQWVRPEIRALQAYHVPPATDCIKLDAMENPYQWPEAMVDEWVGLVKDVELNRYPDPSASLLKDRLRNSMSVPEGADILLGNGSDELIQMLLMALTGKNKTVLSVAPSFVMYDMVATYTGMNYISVPLNDDFSLDAAAFLAAIEQHTPAIIFIAYPNNPTGNLFKRTDLQKIIDAAPGVIVIDEAYHAFADDSFMDEAGQVNNLLVMRTVSKMGLAGLRLGLLAGKAEWLNEFDKVRLPYNLNVLTQATAQFALQHQSVLDAQTETICKNRELLFNALSEIEGLQVYPSQANFILFRTRKGEASAIFNKLKEAGVLIKNLSPTGGALGDCLRVTVGMPEENTAFIKALKAAI